MRALVTVSKGALWSALVAALWCMAPTEAVAQTVAEATPAPPRLTYRFGVDYMLNASGRRNYPFSDNRFENGETFMWMRLRPHFSVRSPRVEILVEGQDTHAVGGGFSARKAWLDLLNAYIEVKPVGGWSFKVGRQQGDLEVIPRMVRTSDFAAVIRSFDVAEVGWQKKDTDLRAFVFAPVDNLPSRFNQRKKGEVLWTTYGKTKIRALTVQSYVVAKTNSTVTSETGVPGSGAVYAWEVQGSGPTPVANLDWTVETVVQRGHYSTDDVRAWGLFLRGDYELPRGNLLDVRYSATSGDGTSGDGKRTLFDTFYAASTNFGSLGLIRGINIRAFSVGGLLRLTRPLTLNWRYFNTFLNNRADVWYSSVTPNIARDGASSSHLGQETTLTLNYRVTPKLLIRTAYYRFYTGAYPDPVNGHGPFELRLQIIGGF